MDSAWRCVRLAFASLVCGGVVQHHAADLAAELRSKAEAERDGQRMEVRASFACAFLRCGATTVPKSVRETWLARTPGIVCALLIPLGFVVFVLYLNTLLRWLLLSCGAPL
jgi:hypothetical protein